MTRQISNYFDLVVVCLPNSALAAANMAELAWRLGISGNKVYEM